METSIKKDESIIKLSTEVSFYTMADMIKLLNWSEATVRKLFNDPYFPSVDFGKTKVVEAHALIKYFSKKHMRKNEKYWN